MNHSNAIPEIIQILRTLDMKYSILQKEFVALKELIKNQKNEEYYHNIVQNTFGIDVNKFYEVVHNKKYIIHKWSNYELAYEQIKTQSYNTSVIFFGDIHKKQEAIEKLKSENISIYEIEEVNNDTRINVIYEQRCEQNEKTKFMKWLESNIVISNNETHVLRISNILGKYKNSVMYGKSNGKYTKWVEEFLMLKNFNNYKSKQNWVPSNSSKEQGKNIRGWVGVFMKS